MAHNKNNKLRNNSNEIAIIGMACRFPGAKDYNQYWFNLINEINSVVKIPFSRWDFDKYKKETGNTNICTYCGLLDDIDQFDNSFFHISPREATSMDPQQRLLLEETWHCIEDSGVALNTLQQKNTSVYVGVTGVDYTQETLKDYEKIDSYTGLGSFPCIIANRISHAFNLHGVSMSIDAACASSLVSLHQAKLSLQTGESDYAFASGICLAYDPWRYIAFSSSHMMSLDGKCRTFDKDANGFIQGEGLGVLLLQRLEDAIADGNHIYGILKGSAVNHCAHTQTITSPSVKAQENVIQLALDDANISPETISYVETHGTGTTIGDPIEVESLSRVFRKYTNKKGFCKLGAVKTNIGHLASAAGVASVIKVLLMMKHKQIPANLNMLERNPMIQFDSSPFIISDKLSDWEPLWKNEFLRAGVNAFGFGGVNTSVIIESFQEPIVSQKDCKQVFLLSAKNEESLLHTIENWKAFVESEDFSDLSLNDICGTLQNGREAFNCRFASVVNNKLDIKNILECKDGLQVVKGKQSVCFYVGEKTYEGYKDVQELLSVGCFIKNKSRILSILEKDINGIGEDFTKKVWQKKKVTLYSFIANCVILETLCELGVKPEIICADGNGVLLGLALSGMLNLNDVVMFICEKETEMKLSRPSIPLYYGNGKSIMPFHFEGKDIQSLIEKLDVSNDIYVYCLEKARLLCKSQHSFMKYIEEWNHATQKYGIDLLELINNGDCTECSKLLLVLAVAHSLLMIYSKWDLSEDTHMTNGKIREIIELVKEDVLSKESLIALITEEQSNYAEIAQAWNQNQNKIDQNFNWFYLKECKSQFVESKNLKELMECCQLEKISKEFKDEYITIELQVENGIIEYLANLWKKGIDIKWDLIFEDKEFQKVSLPVYSFVTKSFWFSSDNKRQLELHSKELYPLLDQADYSKSLQYQGVVFKKMLLSSDAIVCDHQVKGKCIFPGAAQIEMAYEAVSQLTDMDNVSLCDLVFLVPIEFDNEEKPLFVYLSEEKNAYNFSIQTFLQDGKEVVHTTGKFRRNTSKQGETHFNYDYLKNYCQGKKSKEEIYKERVEAGIYYGPYFKGVEQVYFKDNEALALICLPNEVNDEVSRYCMHPAMLDAAFQAMVCLIENISGNSDVLVPFSIDKIQWIKPIEKSMYAHICCIHNNICNVALLNKLGEVCVIIEGVFSRRQGDKKQELLEDALFAPIWKPAEYRIEDTESSQQKNRQIIICFTENSREFAHQIANCHEDDAVKLLLIGNKNQMLEDNAYEINVDSKDAFVQYFFKAEQMDCIYFINSDINDCFEKDDIEAFQMTEKRGLLAFFRMLKGLSANGFTAKNIELKAITNHALSICEEDFNNPSSAEIHGLASSVAKEYVRWKVGVMDVVLATTSFEELQNIAKKVVSWEIEKQGEIIALRNGAFYQEKMCPIQMHTSTQSFLKQKGVYLIIGGTGGIGSVLCDYLAEKYQARLILLGRRELTNEIKDKIQRVKEKGAEAIYVQADIINEESMTHALDMIRSTFGSINGVFHSALVLKDQTVEKMNEDTLLSVVNPKALGSFILLKTLKQEKLDFMLFFSSIQSYVCNAGQGNYASASTFEDAFASYIRETKKINAKVINWGFWGSVGVVASEDYRKRMEQKGMYSIRPEEGVLAIERILASAAPRIAVIKANNALLSELGVDSEVELQTCPYEHTEIVAFDEKEWNKSCITNQKLEQLDKAQDTLDRFNKLSLLLAFQRMGVFIDKESYQIEELFHKMHIQTSYQRLFGALLHILEDAGYIVMQGNTIETTDKIINLQYNSLIENQKKLKQCIENENTDSQAQARLVEVCTNQYPNILRGELSATDVIFPNGTMNLVGNVYRNNFVSDYYNKLVIEILKQIVLNQLKLLQKNQKVRIIEIGAGTGGTSASAFEVLREYGDNLEYYYTDISVGFLQYGQKHYGEDNPYVLFEILDIEKDLEKQKMNPGSFDIVIATNVLHATKSMDHTVHNIQKLLKMGGSLIINEATTVYNFATMSFGLLDGWWLYIDEERRLNGSPLIGKHMWKRLLNENGFLNVCLYGLPNYEKCGFGQNVIVAQSNGVLMIRKSSQMEKEKVKVYECRKIEEPKLSVVVKGTERIHDEETRKDNVRDSIVNSIMNSLGVSEEEVELDRQFTDLGIDSIIGVELINNLNEQLGIVLRTSVLFDYVTVNELTDYILREHSENLKINDIEKESALAEIAAMVDMPKNQPFIEPVFTNEKETFLDKYQDIGVIDAVVLRKPGKIEDIKIEQKEIVNPGYGEVQILVKAFSLNFGDYLCVKGLYPNMPEYPFTTGFEVSGIVIKIGQGVKNVTIGEEVIGVMDGKMGGHSSIVNVQEMSVIRKPSKLTFEEATSLPAVFQTVYHAFEKADLQYGEKILIQSAAGGTGLLAVQIALMKGAEIFACAGSSEKLTYLKQLGVQHVINYREHDFKEEILRITNGTGVDVVFNTLSGDAIQKGIDILAPCGRYIEIALAGLKASSKLNFSKMTENQEFYSIDIRKLLDRHPELIKKYLNELVIYVDREWIKPNVGKIFSFSKIQEAFRYIEERRNIGKVVVTMEDWEPNFEKTIEVKTLETVKESISEKEKEPENIAIIGMSCKLPGADNLQKYWENLEKGICSIREVPKNRWDSDYYYDLDIHKLDKTNCKWGGFLNDIDKFDPLFFHISGKEAEVTDPQQRLLLEECWKALEDAGYANDDIEGTKCGVYMGTIYGDYITKMETEGIHLDARAFWGNACSVTASRISYLLNLKGASIALETACSSSLVAIHLGCKSILSGESEMVIAGGAFINVTPRFYILCSNAGMLSPNGVCSAFDDQANGFVPGEGVGVLILKSLKAAQRDGDHIYGVIKGSEINQDGKTNGITAPSMRSQKELEISLYEKSKINPETISYVEAHGTGTKLGDPIEIEALTEAFQKFTDKKQFCAIGSVKTNIGHTVAASGVASVIKVLLSMKYGKLPASLNYEKCNEQINFENSPFYVNTKLCDWKTQGNNPRRAVISSFGFSGTNAHLLIEEAPEQNAIHSMKDTKRYYPILLSAQTKEALRQRIEDLYAWLHMEGESKNLGDIAYTLCKGRKHFGLRIGITADSKEKLKDSLNELLKENELEKRLKESSESSFNKKDVDTCIFSLNTSNLEEEQSLTLTKKLCSIYEGNKEVSISKFFDEGCYTKLSMPVYPFEGERYWIQETGRLYGVSSENGITKLHPFVHENISDLYGQKYLTTIEKDEDFLADHVVNGEKVLPGAIYLEMSSIAGQFASHKQVTGIKQIVWERPIKLEDDSKEVVIHLTPKGNAVLFEVTNKEDRTIVYTQGMLHFDDKQNQIQKNVDVESYINQCEACVTGDTYYDEFEEIGYHYGKTYRNVKMVWSSQDTALSRIELPVEILNKIPSSILHPSILDAAFQTAAILSGNYARKSKLYYMPFALENIEILEPLEANCYAYVTECDNSIKQQDVKKFNIQILNNHGLAIAVLTGFCMRAVKKTNLPQTVQEGHVHYYRPSWEKLSANEDFKVSQSILIFASKTLKDKMRHVEALQDKKVIWVEAGDAFSYNGAEDFIINTDMPEDYIHMLHIMEEKKLYAESFMHMWTFDMKKEEHVEQKLKMGIYSLFHFVKALVTRKDISDANLIYFYASEEEEYAEFAAMSGFMKTIQLENSYLHTKTVNIKDGCNLSGTELVNILVREQIDSSMEVYISNKERLVKKVSEFKMTGNESNLLRNGGVYLITGGMGGMGYLLATDICKRYKATVVLTGRSALNDTKQKKLEAFLTKGYQVAYLPCDIADELAVKMLSTSIIEKYGALTGIIHCAGVIQDAYIEQKEVGQLKNVLAPKVFGTRNLLNVVEQHKVEFFAVASSLAAVIGNAGQCDYAYANAFMDSCIKSKATNNKNYRYISINWGLWKDGGMSLDQQKLRYVERSLGMLPLDSVEGVEAFRMALASEHNEVIVVKGYGEKLEQTFEEKRPISKLYMASEENEDLKESALLQLMIRDVRQMISHILKVKEENIDAREELSEYGFDSISFTELTNDINEMYDLDITPATIFEFKTLFDFLKSVLMENKTPISDFYRKREECKENQLVEPFETKEEISQTNTDFYRSFYDKDKTENAIIKDKNLSETEIAIVGMSGVMPGSDNLEIFWNNLINQKDLVSEVPKDRWDWKEYDGNPELEPNKTNSRWGGFLNEVDKFDPIFFGISPREAELMDPQQRIFLETVWKTIEDAGYKASDLSGSNTGVFVGVATWDYLDLLREQGVEIQAHTSIGTAHSVLANRISYYFNFKGPSEPVDTACSSSLVAIHRAIQAIHDHECECAIAGGVNVIVSPTLQISFGKAGMLSEDGKCKTFDKDANGYVRGEGCAALLLKPLNKAKKDNDHIYGVIKSSSVNHGGHVNSLTAPNPNAQAELIEDAVRKAGVTVDTISYIECHGTGTPLGDPIEINGLKKAFSQLSTEEGITETGKAYCGLGALKTNIGHLETAAGIASVVKVLLAMKYKVIPANIHFQSLNPYIKLDNSPFYVIDKTTKWDPTIRVNGEKIPRRAGVSAFGFGGANAHVILEEYEESEIQKPAQEDASQVIVISAKTQEQLMSYVYLLKDYVDQIIALNKEDGAEVKRELIELVEDILHINANEVDTCFDFYDYIEPVKLSMLVEAVNEKFNTNFTTNLILDYKNLDGLCDYLAHMGKEKVLTKVTLEEVAYTLQNGREEMAERIAFTAIDFYQMSIKLNACLMKETEGLQIYIGSVKDKVRTEEPETLKEIGCRRIREDESILSREQLAKMWVEGNIVNWSSVHYEKSPRRISLPTYPFDRKRYWIPSREQQENATKITLSEYTEEEMLEFFKRVQAGTVDDKEMNELL